MRADHRSHARDGLAHFKAALADRGAPDALLEHTYAYLLERREAAGEHGDPHYVMAPGHDLRTVYHLEPLDIEDAVVSIADRGQARLPRAHELDAVKERVHTVRDLVLFLEPFFAEDDMGGEAADTAPRASGAAPDGPTTDGPRADA
jgi:hypothetical protein